MRKREKKIQNRQLRVVLYYLCLTEIKSNMIDKIDEVYAQIIYTLYVFALNAIYFMIFLFLILDYREQNLSTFTYLQKKNKKTKHVIRLERNRL